MAQQVLHLRINSGFEGLGQEEGRADDGYQKLTNRDLAKIVNSARDRV